MTTNERQGQYYYWWKQWQGPKSRNTGGWQDLGELLGALWDNSQNICEYGLRFLCVIVWRLTICYLPPFWYAWHKKKQLLSFRTIESTLKWTYSSNTHADTDENTIAKWASYNIKANINWAGVAVWTHKKQHEKIYPTYSSKQTFNSLTHKSNCKTTKNMAKLSASKIKVSYVTESCVWSIQTQLSASTVTGPWW